MIFTNLKNTQNKYLPEKIKQCIDYLKDNCVMDLYSPGTHYIEELNVKMNYDYYETKKIEDGRWESHLKYIDIQVILEGEELITVRNVDGLEKDAVNIENDIIFYKNSVDSSEEKFADIFVPLRKGDLLILYPEDAHKPGLSLINKTKNRKVVFKVNVSCLE